MMISVVIADDHPILRRGMQALLQTQSDFNIIGVASDGLETVRITERLKPDVLVLDLMMPGLSGLEVIRILHGRSPRTRSVVLSGYSSKAMIGKALQAGALGYVLKRCSEENVIRAIREAAAGRRFLSPPVADIAIDSYIEQSKAEPSDPHETLTTRQREVLQLVAEGKTNGEIATRLNISPRTVENHRAILMHRLGLENHTELIRYALRHALLPPDE
jgi:two-component system response regulator NreC